MKQNYFYLRVVKLALCMLLICTSVFAQQQLVTVKLNNVSIEEFFSSIEKQTSYRFSYRNAVIDKQENITVSKSDISVHYLLKSVFENRDLKFSIISDKSIVISDKPKQTNISLSIKKHTVTGTVFDENKNLLPGVVISIPGTTTGIVTGINGEYSINVAIGDILEYSFIGYKTHSIKVGTETILNINLEVEGFTGDEVVIVGFGTQKKSSLTGAISVVKADQLAERPVQNIGQALQGMVPGLNFTANSAGGELNNTLNVDIRGAGTIGTGSNSGVLVLIDGMEGNMNTLNPQDVESISVMKDAASATIYGSRAPFGVILITTKKGSQGKTVVNYNNNFRFSAPINLPESVDSYTFANYYNEGAQNTGERSPIFSETVMDNILKYQQGELEHATQPESSTEWGYGGKPWANNDWFNIHYKDWVFSQEHNASISGGTEKVNYYISANYLDQSGVLNLSPDTYKRLSVSSKVNAILTSWAKIGITTRFTNVDYDKASYQNDLFYHNVLREWPTAPLEHPIDPENPMDTPNYGIFNGVAALRYGGRDNTQNKSLVQQLNLVIEPIKNWTVVSEFNYRFENQLRQRVVIPSYYQRPNGIIAPSQWGSEAAGTSYVEEFTKQTNFMNPNVYTNYEKNWDSGHSFKAMLGFQTETNSYRESTGKGYDLISHNVPTLNNTTARPGMSGTYGDWNTTGFFTRLNYNYKEKYLLEVSARYDGSSRFLQDQRWNLFPSISVGWNMKHENFLKDINAIDMFKLRGSWGQLGNQNINNWYPFYQNIVVNKEFDWLVNGAKPSIYIKDAPALVSPMLTWEIVESWNIGLDFGFFKNRLTGTIEVFNRKTLDMVGPAPTLPGIIGISVPNVNNANLETKGYEFELSWRDVIHDIGLSYGIRASISDARQYVTRYPNETGALTLANGSPMWYSGRELGEIWGYTTVGIAQTDEQMNKHLETNNQNAINRRWGAGDIMYGDLNGDGIIDKGAGTLENSGDQSIIGNSTPRYLYGVTLDAAWKGFDFSIFIQGVGKRDYMPAANSNVYWGIIGNEWQSSGFVQHMDFWRSADNTGFFGSNTNAHYPKPYMSSENNKNTQSQTRYLEDASYARIKNIQLGYTLPSRISNKMTLSNVRVFFSADNIATFTKLSNTLDPETISGGWGDGKVYPLTKVISFGINVTL